MIDTLVSATLMYNSRQSSTFINFIEIGLNLAEFLLMYE